MSIEKMIAERYMIVKHIGQGGMADVYVALDTLLSREVAVKVLRGELCSDPIALLRFQREAQASCALIHPNIVEIYDVGEDHGRHYIVMEYIRGKSLKQLILSRGALLLEEAVDIMKQLVSATAEAHRKGIIHRDIKPQNVLVKDDGTIKLTDFGIALAQDAMQLTQTDSVMGSVHYLAPELARGENATFKSDLYSLGIVFYELLSGSVPFHGDSPVQIALKHMRDEIPSIRSINPSIPQSIENIILKATVKNKNFRYSTAQEMMNDLSVCLLQENRNVQKIEFDEGQDSETRKTRLVERLDTADKKTKKPISQKEVKSKKQSGGNGYALILMAGLTLLGIFGLISVLVLSGTFNQDKMVTVPVCQGRTVNDCMQLLENTGLSINTSGIVYEYTDHIEEGRIVSVSPEEGSEVEKGTQLRIVVSSGKWLVMDNYAGQNIRSATALIASRYSNVRVIRQEEEGSDALPGTILRQELLVEGDKFSPKNSVDVRFVIAAYPNFQIPQSILGINVDDAKNILESMGASVMLEGEEKPAGNSEVETAISGTVFRSYPSIGTWYTQEEDNYITLVYYY